MSTADPVPGSAVDAEEPVLFESSTAPTTPEGSLSFSPVLRPRNRANQDIESANLAAVSQSNSRSLSSTLLGASASSPAVRTICCVGAGYVGELVSAIVSCCFLCFAASPQVLQT